MISQYGPLNQTLSFPLSGFFPKNGMELLLCDSVTRQIEVNIQAQALPTKIE